MAIPLLAQASCGSFHYVSPGCSWYEHHHLGGCHRPPRRDECRAAEQRSHAASSKSPRLAIIVPYRGDVDEESFSSLCARLPAHLDNMGIRFHLLAVNQVDEHPFNRAALANAAFHILGAGGRQAGLRAADQRGFQCLAVHDVDRMPVSSSVNRSCAAWTSMYYTCQTESPQVLHPESFTGGVLVIRPELFRAVNGFSNTFWGWGHEDNELYLRLRACGAQPQHPPELDSCMAHHDCERCKRAKPAGGFHALRVATDGIARLQGRMRNPLAYSKSDGLTTINFTAAGRPRTVQCGGRHTLHIVDVRLQRLRDETPKTCVADGSEQDNGCVASVPLQDLPSGLVSRAKHALPRSGRFRRVVRATRARAMYNFHYELDVEADMADRAQDATIGLFRIAVCSQQWQDANVPDEVRYQLLWRAVATRHRRKRGGTPAMDASPPRFRLTNNFSYHGAFPCALAPPLHAWNA